MPLSSVRQTILVGKEDRVTRCLVYYFSLRQEFLNTTNSEMNFESVFFFSIALALSSFIIVGIILYTKGTIEDMIRSSESTEVYFPIFLQKYTAQRRTTQNPFIYLTETEQCLPRNLASSSEIGDPETCNCDVIVLSFRAKC